MPTVTLFPNAKTPNNPVYIDHLQVIENIKTGFWQHQVDKLNSFEPDSPAQKRYKTESLIGVVWQGRFTQRNEESLTQHSGMVAVDFDDIPPEDMPTYRQKLTSDPYTHVLFTSPRRNGLKVIVRIPPDPARHKAHLAALKNHYRSKYYDHFDDLPRLCFVSYDPDLYHNPDSTVWTATDHVPDTRPRLSADAPKVPDDTRHAFNAICSWASKTSRYSDGNKHCHLIKIFTACNRYGIPLAEAIDLAWHKFSATRGTKPVAFPDYVHRAEHIYTRYASEHAVTQFIPEPQYREAAPATPEPEPEPPQQSFPLEVFPQDVQNFITSLGATLNFSPDFCAVAVMYSIAVLNGNKYKLRVKTGWDTQTLFWFAIVGERGTMKSHPINTIIRPIKHIDERSMDIHEKEMEEYEAQLSTVKKSERSTMRRPVFKQVMINDITLESIHDVHTFNRRGLGYFRDELSGFFNSFNQYRRTGSDEQFWLESFNNQSYVVNRVGRSKIIHDPMISIAGTIQPDVLGKIAAAHSQNGLTDRFLYTKSEKNIHPINKNTIDPAWMKWWDERLNTANRFFEYLDRQDTTILELPPQCMDMLIEIDMRYCNAQRSDDTNEPMKNYISKAKTYLPRFILLMALIDTVIDGTTPAITPDHVRKADKIMQYFISSASEIFSSADRSVEMSDVIGSKKGMTKTETIAMLHQKGYKGSDIAMKVGVSRAFVSRTLKVNQKG